MTRLTTTGYWEKSESESESESEEENKLLPELSNVNLEIRI